MSAFIWFTGKEMGGFELEHKLLREHLPGCEIYHSDTQLDVNYDLDQIGHKVDGICTQIDIDFSPKVLEKLPKCKVISVYGVGYDLVDITACRERGITVNHVPEYCKEDVADHALALLLNFLRCISSSEQILHEKGLWEGEALTSMPRRIRETKGLILGVGRIGKCFAGKLLSLGVQLYGCDPMVSREEMQKLGIEKVSLDEGLGFVDFITIHIPGTPENNNTISRRELSLMKKDAILINVSRSAIVNLADLSDALNSNTIFGAGIDVPFQNQKLLTCKNVVETPHLAYISESSIRELKTRTTMGVCDVLRGRSPENPVF